MTDYLTPSNSNLSFADVIGGKDRSLAEETIKKDIQLLEKAGIPHTIIADTLLKYLKAIIAPPKGSSSRADSAWYLQLQRFRDELQAEIDAIEEIMSEDRH